MNALKLPFAIIAFLVSVVLVILAYLDLTTSVWGPVRQFLATVNPLLTALLGFWVTTDTQRKVLIANDYLADLTELTPGQVRLYYEIRRIADERKSFMIPESFIRENDFHNELRKLRRARLISGTETSRFKPGGRFVLARWTDRLRSFDLKTSTVESWREIEKNVKAQQLDDIIKKIEMAAAMPARRS